MQSTLDVYLNVLPKRRIKKRTNLLIVISDYRKKDRRKITWKQFDHYRQSCKCSIRNWDYVDCNLGLEDYLLNVCLWTKKECDSSNCPRWLVA